MTRGQVMANERFGLICVDETPIQLPFILRDIVFSVNQVINKAIP